MSLGNTAAYIKAGKLKPLAVTASKRVDRLPNIPTFDEQGIKLPLRTWFGYHCQAAILNKREVTPCN